MRDRGVKPKFLSQGMKIVSLDPRIESSSVTHKGDRATVPWPKQCIIKNGLSHVWKVQCCLQASLMFSSTKGVQL